MWSFLQGGPPRRCRGSAWVALWSLNGDVRVLLSVQEGLEEEAVEGVRATARRRFHSVV